MLKPSRLRMREGKLEGRTWWWGPYKPIQRREIVRASEVWWWNCGPYLIIETFETKYRIWGYMSRDYDAIVEWLSANTRFHIDETVGYRWTKALWRTPFPRLVWQAFRWVASLVRGARQRALPVPEGSQEPRRESAADSTGMEPSGQATSEQPDTRTMARIRHMAGMGITVGVLAILAGAMGILVNQLNGFQDIGIDQTWHAALLVVQFLVGAFLIGSGACLRRRRAWARVALLLAAWVALAGCACFSAWCIWFLLETSGGSFVVAVVVSAVAAAATAVWVSLLMMLIRELGSEAIRTAMR